MSRTGLNFGVAFSSACEGVLMPRMLGVCQRSWCPVCRTGWGLDCPDVSRSKGAARAAEKRSWRREAAVALSLQRR